MDIGIIARRYARALLLFACENGHETLVYEQANNSCSNTTSFRSSAIR